MAVARREGNYYRATWDNISVGTIIRVHSKEWFDNNCEIDSFGDYRVKVKTIDGSVYYDYFTTGMFEMCGDIVRVRDISGGIIRIDKKNDKKNDPSLLSLLCWYRWYPEMFECIVDD